MKWQLALGVAGATAVAGRPVSERDSAPSDSVDIGNGTAAPVVARLLIGEPSNILVAEFDGTDIKVTTNVTTEGTAPSWMAFKSPNNIYAVDENSDNLRHFTFDEDTKLLTLQNTVPSAAGLVHLTWVGEHLVGASYASGQVNVFNVESDVPVSLKNVTWSDPHGPHPFQTQSRAHQTVLDPTNRFLAVNDIGTDRIKIIDTKDAAYEIVDTVSLPKAGCGPRHGVFVGPEGSSLPVDAELYVVNCEYANTIEVFEVAYANDKIAMTHVQSLSTFGDGPLPPMDPEKGPFAGAIEVSDDFKHVYVSNRLTGAASDSIAHYTIEAQAANSTECAAGAGTGQRRLKYVSIIDSLGIKPRMFARATAPKYFFSTNQSGESGVVVLSRDTATGDLQVPAVATIPNTRGVDLGPQFVMQIL